MNYTRFIFQTILLLLISFLAKATPDSSEVEKSLQRFVQFVKQNEASTKKNHYFKYQSIELDNATHMAKEYVNGGTSMLNVNDPIYGQITQELSAYNQALGGSKSVYVFHGRYFLSYEARFYKEENKSSYNEFKTAIFEKLGMIEGISAVPYDSIPKAKKQAFVEALESYHKENKKGKLNKKKTTQDLVRRLGNLLKSQNLQAKKIIVVFLLEEYAGDMTEKEGVKGLDKIDVAINIRGNLWSQYLDLEQGFGIVPDIYGFLNSQERNADEFNIALPEAGSNQTERYGKALLAMVKRLLRVEANLKAMQQDFFDYLKERAALEKRLKEYITATNKLNKDQKNQTYIEDKGIIASIIEKLKNLPVGNTGAIVIENAGTGRYEVVKNGGGLPEVIELTEIEKALLGKLYGKGGISLEQLVEWLDFADDTIEKQLDLSCKFCPPQKIISNSKEACDKMEELYEKGGNNNIAKQAIKKLCEENPRWGDICYVDGGARGVWCYMDCLDGLSKAELTEFFKDIATKSENQAHIGNNVKDIDCSIMRAWKLVYDAKGTLNYKTDFVLLKQVASMQTNANLLERLGGEQVLIDIIKKNASAPCHTCQNNKDYLRKMDEYLEDVAYFVNTFGKNTDGNHSVYVFSSGIVSNKKEHVAGAIFMLKVLNRDRNIRPNDFEHDYPKVGTAAGCKADAKIDMKILEFKSWSPNANDSDVGSVGDDEDYSVIGGQSMFQKFANNNFSKSPNSYTQFLCYLRNIGSMSELEYIFDKDLIEAKGQSNAEAYVKQFFRELMMKPQEQTEIFETIWQNARLRGDLFGNILPQDLPIQKPIKQALFATWVSDTQNGIYNFIKVK
jgi:hypothetical protein